MDKLKLLDIQSYPLQVKYQIEDKINEIVSKIEEIDKKIEEICQKQK
jgi:hypothetical protein